MWIKLLFKASNKTANTGKRAGRKIIWKFLCTEKKYNATRKKKLFITNSSKKRAFVHRKNNFVSIKLFYSLEKLFSSSRFALRLFFSILRRRTFGEKKKIEINGKSFSGNWKLFIFLSLPNLNLQIFSIRVCDGRWEKKKKKLIYFSRQFLFSSFLFQLLFWFYILFFNIFHMFPC